MYCAPGGVALAGRKMEIIRARAKGGTGKALERGEGIAEQGGIDAGRGGER